MDRRAIRLGQILGIPIRLDPSWFLVFILITWSLAAGYYPAEFANWPPIQYWVVGTATAILFFASVVLHELGHSVLALHYKIPVKNITLFIFGGVSQIGAEPSSASAEFWIAIAGPLVSFALAAFFALLQPLFSSIGPLLALTKYLAYINGMLGLFNLVPGFPLDGGRVFRSVVWGATRNLRRATIIAATVGRVVAYLFILGGVWQVLGGNVGNGLWIAFIGWFLENAASSQLRQERLQELLAGHKVSDAMNRNYTDIPEDASLQYLVDEHILGKGQRSLIVKRGDQIIGLLTPHHIQKVPQADWPMVTAAQAMITLGEVKQTQPDTELWAALEEMDRDGVNQLPVMSDGQIVGVLSRDDLISYLRTLRQLGM